jgi:hypothetical protein
MAYYIFLKSLRSLEEFRKNPHLKIPPKSPSTNFQSLGKFKNSFFIGKEIFFNFRANRPSGRASPPGPKRPGRSSQPTRPSFPLLLPPVVHRQRCRLLSRCRAIGAAPPLSHAMEHRNERAPLLNSVVCFYSAINTPLFTTGNRRLHGRPLKPSAPSPPSGPIKGGGLH